MQSITFKVSSDEVVAAIVNAVNDKATRYREIAKQQRFEFGTDAINADDLEARAAELDAAVKDAGW